MFGRMREWLAVEIGADDEAVVNIKFGVSLPVPRSLPKRTQIGCMVVDGVGRVEGVLLDLHLGGSKAKQERSWICLVAVGPTPGEGGVGSNDVAIIQLDEADVRARSATSGAEGVWVAVGIAAEDPFAGEGLLHHLAQRDHMGGLK